MNKLALLLLFSVIGLNANGQSKDKPKGETVEWQSPKMYSTESIVVKTEFAELSCKNCKYIEIKTESGLTGIFITGEGEYKVPEKNISDKFYSCMVRFNPADYGKIMQIEGIKKHMSEQDIQASVQQLKAVFKHCYHAGMNALIPPQGAYAMNFTGGNYKDLLVSTAPEKKVVFDFATAKSY
jgi:hypothetical protein